MSIKTVRVAISRAGLETTMRRRSRTDRARSEVVDGVGGERRIVIMKEWTLIEEKGWNLILKKRKFVHRQYFE